MHLLTNINTLQQKITDYFADKNEVIAVYLFGSYAAGKEMPLSDIDLALFFESSNKEALIEKRDRYLLELGRLLRKDIHLVIMNNTGEEMLKQVFSNGKCLLINDAEKHDRLKTTMFIKMAEFDYYRKQFHAGFIKSIMESRS